MDQLREPAYEQIMSSNNHLAQLSTTIRWLTTKPRQKESRYHLGNRSLRKLIHRCNIIAIASSLTNQARICVQSQLLLYQTISCQAHMENLFRDFDEVFSLFYLTTQSRIPAQVLGHAFY